MKKILAVIALVLLPSLSWGVMMPPMYGGGNDMLGSATDPVTITGPLQIVKQTGANIVIDGGFSDTANWTEGTGWSLATGAAVHTGGTAGTLTPAVALTPTPGTTYEVTVTGTFPDTRSLSIAFGGVTGISAWATTRTQIVHITAGTNGTLTFTPTTAGTTLTIDDVSIKPLTNKITASAGPLLFESALSDPSRNEAAMTLNYVVNKAAGNDTGYEINMIDTVSGGSSFPANIKVNGTSVWSVSELGVTTQPQANLSLRYLSTYPTSGSNPAFSHTGTQTTWGSIFKDSGTVGIMNGSDVLSIFDAAITNSDHTGSGNEVRAFNAGNITGDAEATESAVNVGAGWDYALLAAAGKMANTPQAATCADDAAGTNAALTITPTAAYVEVTSADAQGCDVTMGETGMVAGTVVTICVVSVTAGAVNFADSAGVSELAGALAADVNDCITLRYGNTTTWREVSRSVN